MSRPYIADLIDVHQAATLIKANVFQHGQRCGTTTDGFPVWSKFGSVVIDMRESSRFT